MTDTRLSQTTVYALGRLSGGGEVQLTQAAIYALGVQPAGDTLLTQAVVYALSAGAGTAEVKQANVYALGRGRIGNPKTRVWTFTLDGHDYYVLRLGDDLTLVYDVYSEQWMEWADLGLDTWRANVGINWTGGTGLGDYYGSNVLVGDDVYGLLWFLNPNQPYDQHPDSADPVDEIFFDRITMGQVPLVGREVLPCYVAWLTTDMGDPAYTDAGVMLEISDDAGVTFDDMGTVTVTAGDTSPELSWYSLGQITAPGRLFRITDDGAIARIDGMEMNDPDDEK
jgi:hypothetical protein